MSTTPQKHNTYDNTVPNCGTYWAPLRSITGGSAGNVIEWYDFLAYSIFSIYFSKAFFPGGNMTVQLLNAAAVASVGYVVRPLGSWLIGTLADRFGRRLALSLSVAMMSLGSLITWR